MRHCHIKASEVCGSAIAEEENRGVDCDALMHPFGIPEGVPVRPNPQDYCDIPYGSLIPRGVDNLLCAGRCCSAEFHAQGAMRIIGPAMGTGQAAGLAVSEAIDRRILPRELSGSHLRELLIKEGVELDKPCDGYWEELRNQEGDYIINGGDFITMVPKK